MSKSSGSSGGGVLAAIAAVVLIVGVLIFVGPGAALDAAVRLSEGDAIDEVLIDVIENTGQNQGPVEEISGEGGYYTVYFTNPVIPFDDVTTGGLEGNLVDLINEAQSTIDVAVFEFNLQPVADALIAAHNRGVRVRVVHDDEHTEDYPQIAQLEAAGIPAVPDERSAFMHNKFVVLDGRTVWTGSTNLTENGMYRNNNNIIVIESEALAQNYTVEFEEMFNNEFGVTSPSNTPNPVVEIDGNRIENYFAAEDDVRTAIVNVIEGAEESVYFMAFAFTEDTIGDAVEERLSAGVDVRGIFETRGAATEFSECNALLQMGAPVRLDDNPRTFHHKVIIVDNSITVIGSFNFSNNAVESNDENLLIIFDPDVAALYTEEFNRQFERSVEPGDNTVCLRGEDE